MQFYISSIWGLELQHRDGFIQWDWTSQWRFNTIENLVDFGGFENRCMYKLRGDSWRAVYKFPLEDFEKRQVEKFQWN